MTDQKKIDDPYRYLMSRHVRLSCKSSALIDVVLSEEGQLSWVNNLIILIEKMKDMNISRTLSSGSQSRRVMHEVIGIVDPSEIRTKKVWKEIKIIKG